MSSGSSTARQTLAAFVAGREKADRVVAVVVPGYYREGKSDDRTALAPLIAVIERASPGIVELSRTDGGAGFAIRLAERPFPAEFEAPLRAAAATLLATDWGTAGEKLAGPEEHPGIFARILRAVRRLFSGAT